MNVELRTVDYRSALEALRNGVPNEDAVRVLGSNQDAVEQLFLDRLKSIQDAVSSEHQVPGLLIQGGFGTGKSHLLKYLEDASIDFTEWRTHIWDRYSKLSTD